MKKKIFSIILGLSLTGVIFLTFFGSGSTQELSAVEINSDQKKAAIIDQLSNDIPNQYFQNTASKLLEDAGYHVDLYKNEDITFDFYKKLPSLNYEYVVIRSHAVHGNPEYPSPKLFTSEPYTTEKYIGEQLFGQIHRGHFEGESSEVTAHLELGDTDLNKENFTMKISLDENKDVLQDTTKQYFIFGANTVNGLMKGTFPDSTIIMGGCNTLDSTELAEAFVARGASTVIGWKGWVNSRVNDSAMLSILEETLTNGLDAKDAVEKIKQDLVQPPDSKADLLIYSKQSI